MDQNALITGSTDGIGKATALELARKGYTIHILGRNEWKGNAVMAELKSISPEKAHQLYIVDLSTVEANLRFIQDYKQQHESLDLLVLNALAVPNKSVTTPDGIELTFAVGYLSRYIFSIMLNPLLERSGNSRVIHIGEGFRAGNLPFEQIRKPEYGKLKASYLTYVADGYLTHFINKLGEVVVPHEYYHPGFVNTEQAREVPWLFRKIGDWTGHLIEPDKAAKLLVEHILSTNPNEVAGKYYSLGKPISTSKKMINSAKSFMRLLDFSERISGVKLQLKIR